MNKSNIEISLFQKPDICVSEQSHAQKMKLLAGITENDHFDWNIHLTWVNKIASARMLWGVVAWNILLNSHFFSCFCNLRPHIKDQSISWSLEQMFHNQFYKCTGNSDLFRWIIFPIIQSRIFLVFTRVAGTNIFFSYAVRYLPSHITTRMCNIERFPISGGKRYHKMPIISDNI